MRRLRVNDKKVSLISSVTTGVNHSKTRSLLRERPSIMLIYDPRDLLLRYLGILTLGSKTKRCHLSSKIV